MVKKLLIILALAVVGTAGVGYYFWRQATALPSWYQERGADNNLKNYLEPDLEGENTNIEDKIQGQLQERETISSDSYPSNSSSSSNIELEQEDLTELITSDLASKNGSEQILRATKAIHSEIKGDKLEIGAVINLSQLSETNTKAREALEQITEKMPQLKERDIYLSVAGKPEVKGGKIILNKNSKIKIGNLSFTVSEIADRLNLPADKIRDILTLDIPQMQVEDIQLNQKKIKLEVRRNHQ